MGKKGFMWIKCSKSHPLEVNQGRSSICEGTWKQELMYRTWNGAAGLLVSPGLIQLGPTELARRTMD